METKRKGKSLKFIKRIERDGSELVNVALDDMSHLDNQMFKITCLSATNRLYIARMFNTYIVKLKR